MFHLNDHAIGFFPHTYKSDIHFIYSCITNSRRGKIVSLRCERSYCRHRSFTEMSIPWIAEYSREKGTQLMERVNCQITELQTVRCGIILNSCTSADFHAFMASYILYIKLRLGTGRVGAKALHTKQNISTYKSKTGVAMVNTNFYHFHETFLLSNQQKTWKQYFTNLEWIVQCYNRLNFIAYKELNSFIHFSSTVILAPKILQSLSNLVKGSKQSVGWNYTIHKCALIDQAEGLYRIIKPRVMHRNIPN